MPIITNGLVLYLNSKQGVSGTKWNNIAPAKLGLYNATLVGNVSALPDGMTFESDGYVDMNVPLTTNNPTPFTWELRIKCTNLADTPSIIADGVLQYTLYLANNGTNFIVEVGNSSKMLNIPTALRTPEIYLSFSYNPTNGVGSFYVNGTLIGTQVYSINQTFSRDGLFRIGGSYESTPQWWHYKGVIDGFRFYNRILSNS